MIFAQLFDLVKELPESLVAPKENDVVECRMLIQDGVAQWFHHPVDLSIWHESAQNVEEG